MAARTAKAVAPPAVIATTRPRRKIGWWVVGGVVVASLALTTPWWGRGLALFRVQRVEVRGTRFARPADVAAKLGIDTTYSIWNSLDTLERRAQRHPQVHRAHIARRLPSTLIVDVEENLPIALVPSPKGFRVYDDSGRVLPIDPSRIPVDLPIVPRPDTAIFRMLGDIKAEQPLLFARISEARRTGKDEAVLQLINVPVRVMTDVSMDRFLELSSVEADLERRRLRPVELDLRFKDQVIARL
ncbi:MAG: FtsQ-type POTRA domain-containing protein, partial [Gemmatimonadaceae bacterium]